MESECEVRIIKFALIGLFVASIIGLAVWEIKFNPYSDIKTSASDWVEVASGFGTIRMYEQKQSDPPYLMLSQTRDEIRDMMDSFRPLI